MSDCFGERPQCEYDATRANVANTYGFWETLKKNVENSLHRLEVIRTAWLMCVIARTIFKPFRKRETDMAKTKNSCNDAALREIFRNMDAHRAQEIRQAYYTAIENLRTLADALEIEDAKQPQPGGLLIDEHMFAILAIDAMDKSRFGAIL